MGFVKVHWHKPNKGRFGVSDFKMKDNPKVERNGNTEEAGTLEVLISLPDKKTQVRNSLLGWISVA